MRLGIIGLPQSGKTTIFNALTRGQQPVGIASGKMELHTAVVDVPDPRVEKLAEIFQPKKKVYAKVTFADLAGLGSSQGEISGELLNQLSQMDGFLQVVRAFQDPALPHFAGSVDPLRDIRSMAEELLLNDQIKLEAKLDRLQEELSKGARPKAELERELALFERLRDFIQQSKPLRAMQLSDEERKQVAGFGFLTQKPILVLLNLSEGQQPPELDLAGCYCQSIALQGKLEMDIAQLPPQEGALFLQEYGLQEAGLDRLIRASYQLLGLITFFTHNEKEVRAWTLHKGATAPEAAGTIHTDMQQGFIRAEVVSYDDLASLGSYAEARAHAKLRLEGKNYVVQDGDVLTIRFNV